MNIQKSYDQWSSTYDLDNNVTRDLDGIITQKILNGHNYNTVLEIGCGTGKNTQLLAQIAETVFATDFSFGMITKAKSRIQEENVNFWVGDLTKNWSINDQSIDLVVSNLVLEHIENLNFIFGETARVLGNGGRFFISELHPFKQYQGKQANFQQNGKKNKI
ncbi:MAG: class I SAM-dependent methyltransferase, partial [Gammaproteobacteria bacterium]|nr:class I SAM-dependent methyltransferase [Gammaproteobacteria bacterium]